MLHQRKRLETRVEAGNVCGGHTMQGLGAWVRIWDFILRDKETLQEFKHWKAKGCDMMGFAS